MNKKLSLIIVDYLTKLHKEKHYTKIEIIEALKQIISDENE